MVIIEVGNGCYLANTTLEVGNHVFVLQEQDIVLVDMWQPSKKVLEIVAKGQLPAEEQLKEGIKITVREVVDLEVSVVMEVAVIEPFDESPKIDALFGNFPRK